MAEVNQILSDRVYKDIQKALSGLDKADQEAEVAGSCNFPMDDLRQDVAAIRQQLQLVKSNYFPGKK